MSFWETQLTGLAGTAVSSLLSVNPKRKFSSFSGFVSVTESHSAVVQTTTYPIEDGTQGTDHIVRQPDIVTWDIGFPGDFDPETMYRKLHELLLSGIPFDAETGLKKYSNMVLTSLNAAQDSHTGRILRVTLSMQEIIITRATYTTLAPAAQQKNAASTSSTAKSGTKHVQASEVKQSDLSRIGEKVSDWWNGRG